MGRDGGLSRLRASAVCVLWSGVEPPSEGLHAYTARFPARLGKGLLSGLPLPVQTWGVSVVTLLRGVAIGN